MRKLRFDFVDDSNMNLLADFYELTMCASYFENRRNETATFDLFIRKLPPNRSYFVFAGLEQVLLFLKSMRFNEEQVRYLRKKRLIREFFRLHKALFPAGCDVLIMAKKDLPPLTYRESCTELTELFTRNANR